MATVSAPPVKKAPAQAEKHVRLIVTLTSKDAGRIERASSSIIAQAARQNAPTRGPRRLPTRVLTVTTRKSPCGEGTNTWDRFEMRVHKRVVEILVPANQVSTVTKFELPSGVDADLKSIDVKA